MAKKKGVKVEEVEVLNQVNAYDDEEEAQTLKEYGIGIDCHSKFIQVCVMYRTGYEVKKAEMAFSTSWKALKESREWAEEIIKKRSIPTADTEIWHYTLESTGTYHLPVIRAWGGYPSVVNPLLASPSRRKTDKLDANLLAYQNMTGLWPESFVVSDEIQELRVIMRQRGVHQRNATQITNRINNYILRFGHTLGATGSVRNMSGRSVIEDICNDVYNYDKFSEGTSVFTADYVCPEGFPPEIKKLLLDMYEQYDEQTKKLQEITKLALSRAKEIDFTCKDGKTQTGKELIKNLCTVPGIGEQTALLWLTEIVDPLRFPNQKALSAYCGCDPSVKVSAGKVTSQTRRRGNEKIHIALVRAAGTLVRAHSEPFGRWGYNIQCKSSKGGYKKACSAVARRLAVAMYHINLNCEPFSYEKYAFYKVRVKKVLLSEVETFGNYTKKILERCGYVDTIRLAEDFLKGRLADRIGIGAKTLKEVHDWILVNKIEKGEEDE